VTGTANLTYRLSFFFFDFERLDWIVLCGFSEGLPLIKLALNFAETDYFTASVSRGLHHDGFRHLQEAGGLSYAL
jgi:hypothetical protein